MRHATKVRSTGVLGIWYQKNSVPLESKCLTAHPPNAVPVPAISGGKCSVGRQSMLRQDYQSPHTCTSAPAICTDTTEAAASDAKKSETVPNLPIQTF